MKAARKKRRITNKEAPMGLSVDFQAETLQARREWDDIVKVMKEENCQIGILYATKPSFKSGEEIKTFPDKQKLRRFIAIRTALQEILKALL